MFQHVQAYAGDPILSLVETFKQDSRDHKVNLSIGIYFDDAGCLPLPQAVRSAQEQQSIQAQSYLPMEGHAAFRAAALQVILGDTH
ncbi:aminotransferase class I/II-fold pyridoxal phosphate-dependent enzyme, partial [Kingella kingae]